MRGDAPRRAHLPCSENKLPKMSLILPSSRKDVIDEGGDIADVDVAVLVAVGRAEVDAGGVAREDVVDQSRHIADVDIAVIVHVATGDSGLADNNRLILDHAAVIYHGTVAVEVGSSGRGNGESVVHGSHKLVVTTVGNSPGRQFSIGSANDQSGRSRIAIDAINISHTTHLHSTVDGQGFTGIYHAARGYRALGIECSRASDCGILHDLQCNVVTYSSLERVGADHLDGQSSDIVIDRDASGAGNRRIVERQRFGRRVIGHCRAAHAADDLQVAAVLAGHLGAIDIQVISRDVAVNIDVTETAARLDVSLAAIDRGR